jgi:hypothetical protein
MKIIKLFMMVMVVSFSMSESESVDSAVAVGGVDDVNGANGSFISH